MQHIKILYAEDYDMVLLTVKQLLESEGWCVELCRDGASALRRIETREHYDIIILDADMPGIHGLELLKRARSMTHRRRTPIIFFTATDCENEARAAGADVFLKKPNGIRELIPTVERLIDSLGSQFNYRDQHSSSNRS